MEQRRAGESGPNASDTGRVRDLAEKGWDLRIVAAAPVSGGLVNRVWRLEAEDGRVWFLKEYAPDLAGDAERTLQVQEWARRHGVPAPAALRTRKGTLVYCPDAIGQAGECPEAAAVSEFLPGRALPVRGMGPHSLVAMGRLLARLHQALALFPQVEPPQPPQASGLLAADLDESEGLVRNHPFSPEVDQLALACLETKREALRLWHLGPSLYEGAAWQMLHQDFRLDNLLFSADGEVSAVLDFDFAREGYVGWEVMRAAMTASWSSESGGMGLAAAGHVVGAYLRSMQSRESCARRPAVGEVRLYARLWLDSLVRTTWPLRVPYRQPQAYQPGLAVILRDRDSQTRWLSSHLLDVEDWLAQLAR